jgi:hypothetical protein
MQPPLAVSQALLEEVVASSTQPPGCESVGKSVGASVERGMSARLLKGKGGPVFEMTVTVALGRTRGPAVGARAHVVNAFVAEALLVKVYRPVTTTSPPASFKVQDPSTQPSPWLSITYSGCRSRTE